MELRLCIIIRHIMMMHQEDSLPQASLFWKLWLLTRLSTEDRVLIRGCMKQGGA